MGHYHIIQINESKLKKDDYICAEALCDDPAVLRDFDWIGDELQGKDEKEALESIKRQMMPFAYVNVNKKTIRFRKKTVIESRWLKMVNKRVKEFRQHVKEGSYATAEMELRHGIADLSSGDLFYQLYCAKLSNIISDYLCGHLPKMLYIGAILDAHY